MILVGRTLSPFVRRVATSLQVLGLPYEQRQLSTVNDRAEILKINPLGRVPALVIEGGEVLIDSTPILDHLDELVGPERALIPPAGADRRAVLRLVALAIGVMEKSVAAYSEVARRPAEKRHQPLLEQNIDQTLAGLAALEQALTGEWLALGRLTQADVSAVCAFDGIGDLGADWVEAGRYPKLEALSERCNALPAFAATRWKAPA